MTRLSLSGGSPWLSALGAKGAARSTGMGRKPNQYRAYHHQGRKLMKLRSIMFGAAVVALAALVTGRKPDPNARGRYARAQLRKIRSGS